MWRGQTLESRVGASSRVIRDGAWSPGRARRSRMERAYGLSTKQHQRSSAAGAPAGSLARAASTSSTPAAREATTRMAAPARLALTAAPLHQGHATVGQNDIGAAGGAEVGAYAPSSARTTLMTSSTTSDTRYAPQGPRASRLAPAEERRVPGWYATVRDAVAPVSGAPRVFVS